MASEVEICNAALVRLKGEIIISLDQNTENARLSKQLYPQARDWLLEVHPWNFAQRWSNLAMVAAPPDQPYARAFQVPADCVAVRGMEPVAAHLVAGYLICTDAEAVRLSYTARVENPQAMPAVFREALACRLAQILAVKILGERRADLDTEFTYLLREARNVDAQTGGQAAPIMPDLFIRAREWRP